MLRYTISLSVRCIPNEVRCQTFSENSKDFYIYSRIQSFKGLYLEHNLLLVVIFMTSKCGGGRGQFQTSAIWTVWYIVVREVDIMMHLFIREKRGLHLKMFWYCTFHSKQFICNDPLDTTNQLTSFLYYRNKTSSHIFVQ